jgi:RNase P/RNase MRP subunit POP5
MAGGFSNQRGIQMPHTFDARIAKSHLAINDAAELIGDLLADRKKLLLLHADQEALIKRQRDLLAVMRDEIHQLRAALDWVRGEKEDAA